MRHRLSVSVVGLLAFFIAGSAKARMVDFEGTLSFRVGGSPGRGCSIVADTGVGVATINASAGGKHLQTIALGGVTGSGTFIVTDPMVTAGGLISLRMYQTGGGGVLTNLSAGSASPVGGTLTAMGHLAFCLAANCVVPLNIEFQETTLEGEVVGIGIGGVITLGGYVGIRFSVDHAPWTIHTRTLWTFIDEVTTPWGTMQKTETTMQAGFRHGPSSNTSTTALKSGVVSFINPMVAHTEGVAGNDQHIALFSRLTIHFIPEPGMLLLLGSGIAGLVVLGRSRMRRQA